MSRAWVVSALALAGACAAEPAPSAGDIGLTPALVDFGVVPVGGRKSLPVELTSAARGPVRIAEVTTPPDVAAVGVPAGLVPRETRILDLVWSPTVPGAFVGSWAISTAAGLTVEQRLEGTAQAVDPLRASPAALDFGAVRAGARPVATVTLGPGERTIEAYGFRGGGAAFGALVRAPGRELEVTLFADAPEVHEDRLWIDAEDGASVEVPVRARVFVRALRAVPDRVDFGAALHGELRRREVSVQNLGTVAVPLAPRLDGDAARFRVTATATAIGAGRTLPVAIEFVPGLAGTETAVLSLGPEEDAVSIALAGASTGPPVGVASFTPAALDLGAAPVGGASRGSAWVTNRGAADLWIGTASIAGPFALRSPVEPILVPPGRTRRLELEARPVALGAASGALSVAGATLPLSVEGVVGPTPGLLLHQREVAVGEGGSVPIWLENTGSAPLALARPRFVGDASGLSLSTQPPFVLPPGGRLAVWVQRFSPAEPGRRAALTFALEAAPSRLLGQVAIGVARRPDPGARLRVRADVTVPEAMLRLVLPGGGALLEGGEASVCSPSPVVGPRLDEQPAWAAFAGARFGSEVAVVAPRLGAYVALVHNPTGAPTGGLFAVEVDGGLVHLGEVEVPPRAMQELARVVVGDAGITVEPLRLPALPTDVVACR